MFEGQTLWNGIQLTLPHLKLKYKQPNWCYLIIFVCYRAKQANISHCLTLEKTTEFFIFNRFNYEWGWWHCLIHIWHLSSCVFGFRKAKKSTYSHPRMSNSGAFSCPSGCEGTPQLSVTRPLVSVFDAQLSHYYNYSKTVLTFSVTHDSTAISWVKVCLFDPFTSRPKRTTSPSKLWGHLLSDLQVPYSHHFGLAPNAWQTSCA